MGCDIHIHAEKKVGDRFVSVPSITPFSDRCYGTFGFLADVRNYSGVHPIAEARGFPVDASDSARLDYEGWGVDAHTPSWLSVAELTTFDYDAIVEDRRYTQRTGPNSFNGGATCERGQGQFMKWREFLGERFMDELQELKNEGVDRIVFWFDN